ncbi:hypothetical protein G6F31_020283 [Rhizopus arrhizus]|nr:hypothetical protein G6F31_020283 [Rhizopus arrhizus]
MPDRRAFTQQPPGEQHHPERHGVRHQRHLAHAARHQRRLHEPLEPCGLRQSDQPRQLPRRHRQRPARGDRQREQHDAARHIAQRHEVERADVGHDQFHRDPTACPDHNGAEHQG